MALIYNPSTSVAETGESWVCSQPELYRKWTLSWLPSETLSLKLSGEGEVIEPWVGYILHREAVTEAFL